MDPQAYQAIVQEALDALPEHLRDPLRDVLIVIEDRPRPGQGIAIRKGQVLLGLFEGVPLTAWGRNYSGKLPDKITLFRESIALIAGSEEMIPHLIRETLWHELAHAFGFGHDKIGEMEKRWREKRQAA